MQCQIVALAPGQFSIADFDDPNFRKQSAQGAMIWQIGMDYEITAILGCGAYGTVCRGRKISTGQIVAIKRIYLAQVCCCSHNLAFELLRIPFFAGQLVIGTEGTVAFAS